jgi:Protein of unknown function (DUF3300)
MCSGKYLSFIRIRVCDIHQPSFTFPFASKGGNQFMRIALASSLAFTLTVACAPVLVSAATPAGFLALQQPDNSQNSPQYPSQDYPQQQQQQPDNSQNNPPQQDNSPDGSQPSANYEAFSPDQLDNLLSPIALYPDPLLAQVLVAATFPDQVEEAARYVRASGTNGVDDQNWDVSVRAVAHYPTVVEMMADKIDWTTSLGQAYVNQSTDVSASVQRLRHQAKGAGNLESTPQQEVLENDNYIAINPYQPQFLYVPVYDPAIIYFRRPYWGPAITFGVGFPIGGWLNLGFHWGFGGGFGGIYYTGWNPGGWGRGCWNCGWIGRSRGFVNFHNNVYINNRYTNININRTVINRTVNVNNINRYNYVHKNVNYNNVRNNNVHVNNRVNNRNNFAGNGNRPAQGGVRPGQNGGGRQNFPANNNRAGNANLDRNINNSRANDFRGRDNNANANARNDRTPNNQFNRPAQQPGRPANQTRPVNQYRPAQNTAPHAFGRSEPNFNSRESSQRGQASRQQAQRPQQQHQAPRQQSRPQEHSAPRGGGGRHP